MYRNIDLIRMGRDIQGKQIEKARLGLEGKINPWELPEWRPIVEGIRGQADKGLESLTNSLKANEVTGPAAALTLERASGAGGDRVLDLVNRMRGEQSAEQWKATDLGQNINQMITNFVMQKKQMDQAESAAKQAMWTRGIGGGLGGLAGGMSSGGKICGCYIFIEGGKFTSAVRRFRDTHFSPDSFVSIGYKLLARFVVPLMIKSRLFRALILCLMLNPLENFARHYEEGKQLRALLYVPFGLFWCGVWDMMGRSYDFLHNTCLQGRRILRKVFGINTAECPSV